MLLYTHVICSQLYASNVEINSLVCTCSVNVKDTVQTTPYKSICSSKERSNCCHKSEGHAFATQAATSFHLLDASSPRRASEQSKYTLTHTFTTRHVFALLIFRRTQSNAYICKSTSYREHFWRFRVPCALCMQQFTLSLTVHSPHAQKSILYIIM